ncbi:FAS1-like dehydratase domain-containing protein [Nocardiopsis ganjiahuensis]|uniref:FAS1-like dehydratase domain-containing protein n=1 Tax=Nocardiopsis ganjiahuensis TaxID=239984 RepID=UPI00034D9289|nr:MaoC family dehydratase N-terminal domain-containing protein [Nocardiopsis ganjiahuensis]
MDRGTTETTDELVVDPGRVAALAALFDDGLPAPGPGDVLPPLWHWAALSRWPASADIRPDGHPRGGALDPPAEFPRRMFGGGTVRLHRTITVGSTVRRRTRVEDFVPRQGRSGTLLTAATHTELFDSSGGLALTERQDFVFRPPGAPAAPLVPASGSEHVTEVLSRVGDEWELRTDPTVLMRFSAATSNPHRIHYDHPYVTGVEGYPGLVVHGPLSALAMLETVRLDHPGHTVTEVEHRGLRPLFAGTRVRIRPPTEDLAGVPDPALDGALALGAHPLEPAEAPPHARVRVSFTPTVPPRPRKQGVPHA